MHPNGKGKPVDDLPPANLEAEKMLLVSAFVLPEALDNEIVSSVKPGHFIDLANRTIWRHMIAAHADGQTNEALLSRIMAAGELDDDVKATITTCAKTICSGADATTYATYIKQAAEQRKLWELHRELGQQIRDRLPAEDIRGFVSSALESSPDLPSSSRFEFLTSAQLSETDESVPYIVEGVVAELQPTVVGGPSKAMKTGTLCDLLISIQIGGHFVGYFPVTRPKRSWLISGESGQNVIAETARRVCRAANCELSEIGMMWGFKIPRLANAADLRELGRVIRGEGVGAIGVDPLYLSLDTDGKESSMFSMGSMLRPFAEVCVENNCTPIIAHHFRQTIRDFSTPQLQDLSHAGIEQFARQWILLKRREVYRAGTGEHRLHLVTGGSAGHGGAYHLDINEGTRETPGGRFWDTHITPATEAIATEQDRKESAKAERELAKRVEHRQKILDALRTFPKGETHKALREAAGLNNTNFGVALQELIVEGKVERCKVKKHGTKYDGCRLPKVQQELHRDTTGQTGTTAICPTVSQGEGQPLSL